MADNTCDLVKLGNTGNCVEYLQRALNIIGSYGLVEDGVFGNTTFNAVKHYQASRGLVADGQVGSLTWAKIDSDIELGVRTPVTKIQVPSAITLPTGSTLPAISAGVNWTTVGIIAAVALAVIFMLTDREKEY